MWHVEWLWRQCRGIGPQLDLIWGTRSYFALLQLPQGTSRLVTAFLGTVWGSIKQVKAPSVLMGNTELLCMQCRGMGPHLVVNGKSHGFPRVAAGTWGIFLSYSGDGPSKLVFVLQHQDSAIVMRDTSGISSRLGREIGMLLDLRRETQDHIPVATGILGF